MFVDMPLNQLRSHHPERVEADDFDDFWARTLTEARTRASSTLLEPVETGMVHVDTYDVTFTGFAGQPVKAWLRVPKNVSGPLPAVVEYLGYGSGRGLCIEPTLWSSLGYVHLLMDSRGQSSHYSGADTPDGDIAPQIGGHVTRGIASPVTYYYRRLFTDAARAVDVTRELQVVDGHRIVVKGISQGGGIAIAAAALSDGIAAAMIDVPFLCQFRHATQITDAYPYREISDYLQWRRDDVERVFTTLNYFDGVNLAARADAPVLFSAALMDPVCPPSTVFAAYNHWCGTDKDIRVWEYNAHDAGAAHQLREQIAFLKRVVPQTARDLRQGAES